LSRFASVSDPAGRESGRPQAKSRAVPGLRVLWLLVIFLLLLPALGATGEVDPALLLQNGKADQALQVLNAQIAKNPNDAQLYNLMARVYFQLERWDESIKAAEKSIALAPQVSEYHQWVARACGEKADAAGALTAFNLVRKVKSEFEKAVALDAAGKNLSAHSDLAEFYIEAPSMMGGDKSKARRLAEFIMKDDPALAHYLHARLEEKQNAKERAEEEYKAAIQASGNLARYWVSLASFYRRVGRLDDMESALSKSRKAAQQDGVPLFDGASLLLTGGRNFPEAIAMLRHYLSLDDPVEDGPSFQAHYLLGVLLEKQGDVKAATAEYRAAVAMASEYRPAQEALARVGR